MARRDVTDLDMRIAQLQGVCNIIRSVQSPEAATAISAFEEEIAQLQARRQELLLEEDQQQDEIIDRIDKLERTVYLFEPIIKAELMRSSSDQPAREEEEPVHQELAPAVRQEQAPREVAPSPELLERLISLENIVASARRKLAEVEERTRAIEQRPQQRNMPAWAVAAIIILALAVIALGALQFM